MFSNIRMLTRNQNVRQFRNSEIQAAMEDRSNNGDFCTLETEAGLQEAGNEAMGFRVRLGSLHQPYPLLVGRSK